MSTIWRDQTRSQGDGGERGREGPDGWLHGSGAYPHERCVRHRDTSFPSPGRLARRARFVVPWRAMMPTLSLLALLGFLWPSPAKPAASRATVADKGKVLDEGTFAITINGRRAGQESFEIVDMGKEIEIRTATTIA